MTKSRRISPAEAIVIISRFAQSRDDRQSGPPDAVVPRFVQLATEDYSGTDERVLRLLEHIDLTSHVCLQASANVGVMRRDHLSVPTPNLYTKGVDVYKPQKLSANSDNTSDSKRISFCSWNPGSFSRQRPDPQRQLQFVLNHEISVLQEADREGPFIVAAFHNSSSFTCAGEATGLAQIQSSRGYCCSCEYWSPELTKSGTLYRAFLTDIGQPESLRKQFPDIQGNMHNSRRWGPDFSRWMATVMPWCLAAQVRRLSRTHAEAWRSGLFSGMQSPSASRPGPGQSTKCGYSPIHFPTVLQDQVHGHGRRL